MDYHPERSLLIAKSERQKLRDLWDVLRAGNDLKDSTDFQDVFRRYVFESRKLLEPFRASAKASLAQIDLLPEEKQRAAKANSTPLRHFANYLLAPFMVVTDFLIAQTDWNYGKLLADPRYRTVSAMEDSEFAPHSTTEALTTNRILQHALNVYVMSGSRLYTVAPGLEFQMRNIQLRNMPEEFLHLPVPSLYLVCPKKDPFKVFNEETGWHDVEGMYLVKDDSTIPRSWRIIMAAGPNEKYDDALYHWYVMLKEGLTLEECIHLTIDSALSSYGVAREIKDTKMHIESPLLNASQKDIFENMRSHLVEAFRYAVNVILYVTHPDAEKEIFNSSPEYQALYRRALNAKGKKRNKLLARARDIKGNDRVRLGQSVVISREERHAIANPERKGTKHSVRTYVGAHWQHFWTGPMDGERVRKYLLKKAYWKGPENAPLSTTGRKVK